MGRLIMARDVGFEPTRPFDHRLSRPAPYQARAIPPDFASTPQVFAEIQSRFLPAVSNPIVVYSVLFICVF